MVPGSGRPARLLARWGIPGPSPGGSHGLDWGITTPEMVTPREETLRLATDYNRALGQRHGATGTRLELLPAVGPGFAGLSARLRF
jgi:hypothetical protein